MVSSIVMSLEDLFPCLSLPRSLGRGGGEVLLPGGVTDRRDLLEVLDGVLYGVSTGVGNETAAGLPRYSSSVSHAGIVTVRRRRDADFLVRDPRPSGWQRKPQRCSIKVRLEDVTQEVQYENRRSIDPHSGELIAVQLYNRLKHIYSVRFPAFS